MEREGIMPCKIELLKGLEYDTVIIKGKIQNKHENCSVVNEFITIDSIIETGKKILVDITGLDGYFSICHSLERANIIFSYLQKKTLAILENKNNNEKARIDEIILNNKGAYLKYFLYKEKAVEWLKSFDLKIKSANQTSNQ